jgi:hypothetical protein
LYSRRVRDLRDEKEVFAMLAKSVDKKTKISMEQKRSLVLGNALSTRELDRREQSDGNASER